MRWHPVPGNKLGLRDEEESGWIVSPSPSGAEGWLVKDEANDGPRSAYLRAKLAEDGAIQPEPEPPTVEELAAVVRFLSKLLPPTAPIPVGELARAYAAALRMR